MKIAVEGCAHGELDKIYSTIKEIEEKDNIKIDLLICCGDFQSSRNEEDLSCMAVPPKYRHMCSFYKYYSGEKKAPVLTIFIGGNHEASNYLQELPYGGWVAPRIYYLGYAGVIDIAGVRIGGLSGIYKARDYYKGRFEKSPYDENAKRSVYHIRNLEIFRLKQLSQSIDVFLSHDWPTGVYRFGNVQQLLKIKPYFRDEIDSNQLGSQPCEELLKYLKPKHWFAAHLHCKFSAQVPHPDNSVTKFLALDKCLPRRQFLQVVDIPHDQNKKIEISYDLEWMTILFLTNHLLSVKSISNYMPGPGGNERYNFTPTEEEKSLVFKKLGNVLKVPKNFRPTAMVYEPHSPVKNKNRKQPAAKLNPQTMELCEIMSITDPICLISENTGLNLSLDTSFLENSTFICDSDSSSESDSESSSSVNESDVSAQENKVESQVPRTPMKLPKPVKEEESDICAPGSNTEMSESNVTKDELDLKLMEEKEVSISPAPIGVQNGSEKIDQENKTGIVDASENKVIENNTKLVDTAEDSIVNLEKEVCSNLNVEPLNTSKTSPKRTLDNEATCEKLIDGTNHDNLNSSNVEDTPTPKKFKRRNANIYASENNDL